MTAVLRNRVNKLEKQLVQITMPPILIYCDGIQTFEEAKEQYKNRHGFELPGNAKVIRIVEATKPNISFEKTNK